MTVHSTLDTHHYIMHPRIELAYGHVHDWFDTHSNMKRYQNWDQSCARRALSRENPVDAAFNFHYYFATHHFKACHTLQSDGIIGFGRLAAWLRYNPYITVIDVGCGDGAGSIAVIDTVLRLRERQMLDPRPIQVYCIGIDPNPNGLSVYEKMITEVANTISELGVEVEYAVCPCRVSEASGTLDSLLFDLRCQWQQPSLSHAIVIEANLNDLLEQEQQKERERLRKYGSLNKYSPESFGRQLASFYRQLFEGTPIDHLHILSIDTEPNKIQKTVKEMLSCIKDRFDERGHTSEFSDIHLERIKIRNPARSFWRKRDDYQIKPFVVSACHVHNREIKLDARWQNITSQENLELAWARARQQVLREAFSDEIEIRLFEHDLESNLERLHFELDAYAIHAGYVPHTLSYNTPKSSHQDRPRGLTWLEEEILMIAIIQVIGVNVLQQKPWSYAYRLSPENSLERGATEYLYERWIDGWESFLQDVREYAEHYQEGVVIKTDIKSYYTRILQDRLGELVKDELKVSKRIEWLIKLLINKDLDDHDPGRGLVQGSVGSGFLANTYLTPLDNLFPVNDLKCRRLFRYVDDIVVVVPDSTDEQTTKDHLMAAVADLDLDPNLDKTDTYSAREYLLLVSPDNTLDQLKARYEQLIDPLWDLDQDLRLEYRQSAQTRTTWWSTVSRYLSCLTELGLYTTEEWLSRKLSTTISRGKSASRELRFPDLPFVASISEAREWADEFRSQNSVWVHDIETLKTDLCNLFRENLAIITDSKGAVPENDIDLAGRRLRFVVNRLCWLGLDSIHLELTELLCEMPWLVRDHHRLVADLARQGYSSDVWHLVEFHQNGHREMSVYMTAVALRAVRFLSRLEPSEWRKLIDFMFVGEEISKLMATETWLVITSTLSSVPLADEVQERAKSIFAMKVLPTRRLIKNYLLLLGRISPTEIGTLNVDSDWDPLISSARDVSSNGSVSNLILDIEPEILRHKYYSAQYHYYDDGGGSLLG